MRRLRPIATAAFVAMLCAGPATTALAGSDDDLPLSEKLDRALREMMDEIGPALDDALGYIESFGAIDDPRYYQLPEVLPNGDVIIRRRPDAPEYRPDAPDEPALPEGLPIDPGEGIPI